MNISLEEYLDIKIKLLAQAEKDGMRGTGVGRGSMCGIQFAVNMYDKLFYPKLLELEKDNDQERID